MHEEQHQLTEKLVRITGVKVRNSDWKVYYTKH